MSKKNSKIKNKIDDDLEDEEEEEEEKEEKPPKAKKNVSTKKISLVGRKSKQAKVESEGNGMEDDDVDEMFDTKQPIDEQMSPNEGQDSKDKLPQETRPVQPSTKVESRKSLFVNDNKPQTKTDTLTRQFSNPPQEMTISRGASLEEEKSKAKENKEPSSKIATQSGQKSPLADRLAKFKLQPVREFYEERLTPILLEGLKEVGRQRPEDPVKFLGEYLINFNAKK